MNRAAIAVLAAGALVTAAAAVYQLKQARGLLRQLRVETREFEEDRSRLVDLYIEARRKLWHLTDDSIAAARSADE